MGSFGRKLKKQQELKEQQNIKNLYGKKPKGKCPKCKKHSLFFTNEKGQTFCIRCDNIVAIKEK